MNVGEDQEEEETFTNSLYPSLFSHHCYESHYTLNSDARMGKKGAKPPTEPTPSTPVISRDCFQRLNYLYQASNLINSVVVGGGSDYGLVQGNERKRKFEEGGGNETVSSGQGQEEEITTTTTTNLIIEQIRTKDQSIREEASLKPISQHLIRTMQDVAKKATIRM